MASAARYAADAKRYKDEQKEIEGKAHDLEKERDEKSRESEHLMHRHHIFAYSVTFSQVAIALSAIAALTKRRPMWYLSLVVGAVSIVFVVIGLLAH